MLLRVCLRSTSDENRDGGRAFSRELKESQLRFAVPVRIALQGEERADSVAIAPALCKMRAVPGLVWPAECAWPWISVQPNIREPVCSYAAIQTCE